MHTQDATAHNAAADHEQEALLREWVAHRQAAAARRALSIVNRLRPGPTRARHASRVFGNLNRLRAQLRQYQNRPPVQRTPVARAIHP